MRRGARKKRDDFVVLANLQETGGNFQRKRMGNHTGRKSNSLCLKRQAENEFGRTANRRLREIVPLPPRGSHRSFTINDP